MRELLLLCSLFHTSFSCTWACTWIHLHALSQRPKVLSKYWMKNSRHERSLLMSRVTVKTLSLEFASVQQRRDPRTHARTHACCCCISALERLYVYTRACPSHYPEITKWNYICCLAMSLSWLVCGGGRKSISVIVCTKITANGWTRGCNSHHAVPDFHRSPVFLSVLSLIRTALSQEPRLHEQLTRRSTCHLFVRPGNVGFFFLPPLSLHFFKFAFGSFFFIIIQR